MDGQCRRYRPEHCMRKGDTMRLITSTSKFRKTTGRGGDKQNKQADKQAPAPTLLVSSINGSDINATTHA